MSQPVIEFFWDPASTYTYLAATQIGALAGRHGAKIVWRPFLLGKVFEATGNRPPVSVPAKGKHLLNDVRLWAKHYGVPFRFPSVFPVASLTALRIACGLPEEQAHRWAYAILHVYWTQDRDIGQPEVLREVALGLGLDPDATLALAQDPAVKEQLKTNTEEAVRRGVFGAPTFFIGEHMFWGNDRFELMEAVLTGRLA